MTSKVALLLAALPLVLLRAEPVRAQHMHSRNLSRHSERTSPIRRGLTYNKDIAPIINHNCASCHHSGGIAPFPLTTYGEVKRQAALIQDIVESREMPPWKPVAGCGDFQDARVLAQGDIDAISDWVIDGAKEGLAKDQPAPPQFSSDWQLGRPDIELAPPKAFVVSAHGGDKYRCFVLPWVAPQDTFVTGIEVKPDKASIVHHVLLFSDPQRASEALSRSSEDAGYECFGGPGVPGAEVLAGWAPGSTPHFLPEGVASKISAGSRVIMQVHYHLNGSELSDQTRVGLTVAKKPVEHEMQMFMIANHEFKIPAGARDFPVAAERALPEDSRVIGVFPHMHMLGKTIKLEAVHGSEPAQCMVHIKDWDFHWQSAYLYKEPLKLPAGTLLRLSGTYDNSDGNPMQPNDPPKDVTWGESSTDEMFLAFVGIISDRPGKR